MANEEVNTGRRRFLTATTAVVGGVGGVFAAVPFIKAWQPSARAQTAGAPVIADISKLEVGARVIEMWRGQPVWIIRRTPEVVAALASQDGRLKDAQSANIEQQPDYARNETRSRKPERNPARQRLAAAVAAVAGLWIDRVRSGKRNRRRGGSAGHL